MASRYKKEVSISVFCDFLNCQRHFLTIFKLNIFEVNFILWNSEKYWIFLTQWFLKTWLISWHFFGMNRKCQISEAQLVAQSSKKAKQTMQLLLLISLRNYPKIQIFSTCNWISQFSHIFKWFNDALKTACIGCGFALKDNNNGLPG